MSNFCRILVSSFVVALILSTIPISLTSEVAAQSVRAERAVSAQVIHLSELESRGRASALYRLLHSDSRRLSSRDAVTGWYENEFFPLEPQPVVEILEVRFMEWQWAVNGETYRLTAEVDYVQPFGTGSNVDLLEETVRLVEEDGEWRWFFGRSREFVDAQNERYGEPDTQVERDEPERDRSRGCELVELYPGYPGYRGNITGVLPHWGGMGDYACLSDLEEMDSGFRKSREDQANARAADALGIDGSFADWTWENWMMIEIERGHIPQCYACLMFDSTIAPINPEAYPDPDDPRIQSGLAGTRFAVDQIATVVTGNPAPNRFFYAEDYVLRAEGYLFAGWSANAPQLVNAMTRRVEDIFTPGGGTYSPRDITSILMEQGGYMPSEYGSMELDQILFATYTLTSLQGSSDPQTWDFYASLLDDQIRGWKQSGYRGTLAEWLRDNWDF